MSRLLSLALLIALTPFAVAQNGTPVVVIDPGHGGPDAGLVHGDNLFEKTVTLAAAHHLAAILRSEGFDVRLTREDDNMVSFRDRQRTGEGASLLISIHVASHETQSALKTFIPAESVASQAHARRIAARLLADGLVDHVTLQEASFAVLQGPAAASVMLEIGVDHSPGNMQRIAGEEYLSQFAEAVASAIRERAF